MEDRKRFSRFFKVQISFGILDNLFALKSNTVNVFKFDIVLGIDDKILSFNINFCRIVNFCIFDDDVVISFNKFEERLTLLI